MMQALEFPQRRAARILAIHLPCLPTERIMRHRNKVDRSLLPLTVLQYRDRASKCGQSPDQAAPLVIVDKLNNGLRIVALADDPRLAGIHTGQSLSDARAVVPDIEVVRHDAPADRELLLRIARWCERFTPLVSLSGRDGLFLDITGCAHLFGGEAAMLEKVERKLAAQGFCVSGAIAGTAGAAWAVSRFSKARIVSPGGLQEALFPLPLAALRLESGQVRDLSRLGLKTVGCIATRPRAPLAARFGEGLLTRLDQALGSMDEVLSPLRRVAEMASEKRFAEPLVLEEDIRKVIALLAENLTPLLERRGLGVRACELVLFRVNGEVVSLDVETSAPMRDGGRLARLFDERLTKLHDEWEAGFGFDVMRLSVHRAEEFSGQQQDMVTGSGMAQTAHLVDRLSARLGADRVKLFRHSDTHIPERRFGLVPAIHADIDECLAAMAVALPVAGEETNITRPVVLFDRPEIAEVLAQVPEGAPRRFRWRKVRHEVIHAEGPERIACEWWRDGRGARTRDYFRVETGDGQRLWLFRDGLYGREQTQPRWYVHGLFG